MSPVIWIAVVVVFSLAIWLFLRWFHRRNKAEVYGPWDDDRQLAKLEPYFRRDVVEAKVEALFPRHDPAEILRLLDNVVPSFWGRERMQLDILKLSNGDMDQLRNYIEVANSEGDSMKVINLAEYPESSRRGLHDKDLFWGENKREIERDFRQYLTWLKKR